MLAPLRAFYRHLQLEPEAAVRKLLSASPSQSALRMREKITSAESDFATAAEDETF
jgi:hypothetical protein